MRVTSKTEYVSRETGEHLTKALVDKKYVKIKCTKSVKKLGWCIQINYLWECEINNQLKLL